MRLVGAIREGQICEAYCAFCIVLTERCPVEGARDTFYNLFCFQVYGMFLFHTCSLRCPLLEPP